MYQHLCSGAECPHCSPFAIHTPEVATAGRDEEPYATEARQIATSLRDIRERMQYFRDSCGNTVMQYPKRIVPSATVIIIQTAQGQTAVPWKVLCQQRADNGRWGFPGGAQDIGESLPECATREALEETGLSVYLYGVVCADSDPALYAISTYVDGCVQYSNLTFLAGVLSDSSAVRCCPESLELRWCRTDNLPEPFLLNHRWRLEKALGHRGPFLPVR